MEQTYNDVFNKYGKTHTIRVWNGGTIVNLKDLASNQIVCSGDGKNYHWLLTEKPIVEKHQLIRFFMRLLAFPFYAVLLFLGTVILFARNCKNFIRYGGESIAYSKKTQRKTISDVFNLIQEDLEIKKRK